MFNKGGMSGGGGGCFRWSVRLVGNGLLVNTSVCNRNMCSDFSCV